jgi:Tfp pilus assembly protein PilF
MKEFEEALRNHPTNITRLASADFYSHQGQYPKTVGLLDEVLATDPNNTEALEKLADALDEQGSSRLTETTDRLLKVSPESAIGLYHLATTRLYENRFDDAIRTARHALERDPASSRTRNVLAIAYEKTFQPDLAEAEFRSSITRTPDDWISYNNYGIFLLGRNRVSDAREQFQRAIRLNPENVRGFLGMSEVARQTGNARNAEEWYQKALRLDPSVKR